jgi:hypothetical protein
LVKNGLKIGPFLWYSGVYEDYKKRFLGKTIMNNKTYLILLSSLIACSSWAMVQSTSCDKLASLQHLAALKVLQTMDNRIRTEVAFEKAIGSKIHDEQVYEKMMQHIDKLRFSKDSSILDSMIQIYRQVYKRHDADLCDQELIEGRFESIDCNADHTKISVIVADDTHYLVADNKSYLEIWEDDGGGFKNTISKEFKTRNNTVKWGVDNNILVRADGLETIYKIQNGCLQECYKLFGVQLGRDTATIYRVKDNKLPEDDGIVIPYDNNNSFYKRAYVTDSEYTVHQDDEGQLKAVKKVRRESNDGEKNIDGDKIYGDEDKKIIIKKKWRHESLQVTTKLPVLRRIAEYIADNGNERIVSFKPILSEKITGEGSDDGESSDPTAIPYEAREQLNRILG